MVFDCLSLCFENNHQVLNSGELMSISSFYGVLKQTATVNAFIRICQILHTPQGEYYMECVWKWQKEKEKSEKGRGDCDFPYIISRIWNLIWLCVVFGSCGTSIHG